MQRSIDDLTRRLGSKDSDLQGVLPSRHSDELEMLRKHLADSARADAEQREQIDDHARMLKLHSERLSALRPIAGAVPPVQLSAVRPALYAGSEGPESFSSKLEARLTEHDKELAALKSLIVEVHMNMLKHAVKTSRIAIRSTDFTQQQRMLALQSLAEKESRLEKDFRRKHGKVAVLNDETRVAMDSSGGSVNDSASVRICDL